MVEELKLHLEMEQLKQKLKLTENPLLRHKNSNIQAKGAHPSGQKITHVVSSTIIAGLLRSLLTDRLCQEPGEEEREIQFHSDPLSAINACFEGDTYCLSCHVVHGTFSIADSIELEGYGLPDDIVMEQRGKGDTFVDCTGADIKISGIKFVQHNAVEGILIMKSAFVSEGAGIEISPGSRCTLSENGIHHCKEGTLIKDFLDDHYDIPKISTVNNIIHNNEGYGVVLVKPTIFSDLQENADDGTEEDKALKIQTSGEPDVAQRVDLEELIQCATGKMELYARTDPSEQVEGNFEIVNEVIAASTQKGQMKKKRSSDLGIAQADDDLMSQEMFVGIVRNQFKWNGKGGFGTFLSDHHNLKNKPASKEINESKYLWELLSDPVLSAIDGGTSKEAERRVVLLYPTPLPLLQNQLFSRIAWVQEIRAVSLSPISSFMLCFQLLLHSTVDATAACSG
ncbi:SHC SH2 domain-binding protein 1 [Saguinus oedipus]|uniref:SHC SH2 domain-binding protein 1 n=1 Tax=Saguinus oedipus TaxID=9490 RepID=A0ABQ9U8H9_SAGOE|nr:SHC SH2 domain-binding protein 1 [Saguinus oedipus]